MLSRILIATDDAGLRRRLRSLLEEMEALCDSVRTAEQVWKHLSQEACDLILVTDNLLPGPPIDTIRSLREAPDSPEVVLFTERETDPEERAGLLASGCSAVLTSGLASKSLSQVLDTLLEKRLQAAPERAAGRRLPAAPNLSDFVSSSVAMRAFMGVVRRVVSSDASLLILGETGVGKEWLARAIHNDGPRSRGPFVAVNCGAFPDSLLESELFGHGKGAFTGASRSRRGWFELAHGGTVFLDEIAEMSTHLQVKLLRFLQEHEIVRVGGEKPIHVDVRVMAATNRDVLEDVETRSFRRDLYYRLSVVSLTIPPLRERQEDITDLVASYVRHFQRRMPSRVETVSAEALAALMGYDWPGNVRELINVVERAMLLCETEQIGLTDLPESVSNIPARIVPSVVRGEEEGADLIPEQWLEKPWAEVRELLVADFEKRYLAAVLQRTGGKVGEAAKRAGMRSRSLYAKMKHHGLRKEDFKSKREA